MRVLQKVILFSLLLTGSVLIINILLSYRRKDIEVSNNSFETLVSKSYLDELKFLIYPPSMNPRQTSYLGETDKPIQIVQSILNYTKNGFFIESGGFDGESGSNSLNFEIRLNWTGILIEPNPNLFKILISKNRKCYAINACLGVKELRSVETFHKGLGPHQTANAHLMENLPGNDPNAIFTAVCYPLYDILRALEVTTVHFWTLDVEGAEYGVLGNVPFDVIDIKTIMVEYLFFEIKQKVTTFLLSKNYFLYADFMRTSFRGDLLFVKEGVIPVPETAEIYSPDGRIIQNLGMKKFVLPK